MGQIITPQNFDLGINHTGRPEFSVIAVSSLETDLRINGAAEDIMRMIGQVMSANEDIAKTVITAVLIFCADKGIEVTDLKKHSFLL